MRNKKLLIAIVKYIYYVHWGNVNNKHSKYSYSNRFINILKYDINKSAFSIEGNHIDITLNHTTCDDMNLLLVNILNNEFKDPYTEHDFNKKIIMTRIHIEFVPKLNKLIIQYRHIPNVKIFDYDDLISNRIELILEDNLKNIKVYDHQTKKIFGDETINPLLIKIKYPTLRKFIEKRLDFSKFMSGIYSEYNIQKYYGFISSKFTKSQYFDVTKTKHALININNFDFSYKTSMFDRINYNNEIKRYLKCNVYDIIKADYSLVQSMKKRVKTNK